MSALPPVPHKTPMLDAAGILTAPWAGWFRDLFSRVGGSAGETASSVASDLASHIAKLSSAHSASAISNTPSGKVVATDVQSAINGLQAAIDAAPAGAQWYSGSGSPSASTGVLGDFYLDSATGDYYKKTTSTSFALQGSIKGPVGSTGLTGPTGSSGPQGPQGPPGGAVNTNFATRITDGAIYCNALNGHVYLLEFSS